MSIRLWMLIVAVCGAAVAGYGFAAGAAQFAILGVWLVVMAFVLLRHNERQN